MLRVLTALFIVTAFFPAAFGAEIGREEDPPSPAEETPCRPWWLPDAWSGGASGVQGPESAGDLGRESSGPLGSLTCRTQVADPRARRDDPLAIGWRTEDSWSLDGPGPLFLFGNLNALASQPGDSAMNLSGKTGLGWKVTAPLGAEVTLRGGPQLTYSDAGRPEQAQQKSQLFVEVTARCPLPLPGQVGLEYQGSALPALGPLGSNAVKQELRLAIPVGDGGVLRLGAKHQWDDTGTARTWRDGLGLFLGLEVKPGAVRK